MRALLLAATLLTSTLLAGCGQGNYDADGDRLYDSVERAGWDITVDLMNERVRRHVVTDPHNEDTDGDGLTDTVEFQLPGLDASAKDTDGDGLTDCQEVQHTVVAECEDPAFGGPYDGGYGTNAARADSDPGYSRYVNNNLGFFDRTGTLVDGLAETGDGISDGEEIHGYDILLGSGAKRTISSNPMNGDMDDDGLEDGEERFLFASDPTVPDSDGDGCVDGLDLWPERVEAYKAGLGEFLLKRQNSANLQVQILVANYAVSAPMGGTVQVNPNERVDMAPYEGPPGRGECSYAPYNPWVLVEVLALDSQPSSLNVLDMTSSTPAPRGPGQSAQFYWNVRDDLLSWTSTGADSWGAEKGLILEGRDARLALRPVVV